MYRTTLNIHKVFCFLTSLTFVFFISSASYGSTPSSSHIDELSIATLDQLELSFVQCTSLGDLDVQKFTDCMMWDLAYMEDQELITEDQEVALVQCSMLTDPQSFRDCAFGHISF